MTLRFVHKGDIIEIANPNPTRTVLEWLREDVQCTGSKEGCGEGDCGACTAVVASLEQDGQTIRYDSINTCILFLPMLDGKALITVEDLAADGQLHPAQHAMVTHHGSQCGFCTPGFVTSLFALHRKGVRPNRNDIQDALAGNLCRCTGYGPIITAAEAMFDLPDIDVVPEPQVREKLKMLPAAQMLSGTHNGCTWFSPSTVHELADCYAAHPEATLVSGATDVGLWVTKAFQDFETLIFLGRVPELNTIESTADGLNIGATVTYTEAHDVLTQIAPDLGELIRRIGSHQVRNSGTIGGNIANGSPIGDMPPALIALGATVILRLGADKRSMPLEDFFIAYGQQDRNPGEFVEGLFIPNPNNTFFKAYKISKRFDQDISAVCGAFAIRITDGHISYARVAFGGMAGTPARAKQTEQALIGAEFSENSFEGAARALSQDFTPLTDMRGSAEYRLLTAQNLIRKCGYELLNPEQKTRLVGAGS